jgi:hypothetical protein
MYELKAPLKTQLYQVYDFGSVTFTYPSSLTSTQVDEVVISNNLDDDENNISFVSRYKTWLAFTDIQSYKTKLYNIILIHYDRVNQVAYTKTDRLRIVPYDL